MTDNSGTMTMGIISNFVWCVSQRKPFTITEFAQATGTGRTQAKRFVGYLVAGGYLVRTGTHKPYRYYSNLSSLAEDAFVFQLCECWLEKQGMLK